MQKNPKTAAGSKKSAKGLLRIERVDGKLVQYDQQTREQEQQGLLQTVFLDGKLVRKTTLQEIRNLVREQLEAYI
jgi:nicotinamide phosphoribosyltransferase